jgi:hypothetical protein
MFGVETGTQIELLMTLDQNHCCKAAFSAYHRVDACVCAETYFGNVFVRLSSHCLHPTSWNRLTFGKVIVVRSALSSYIYHRVHKSPSLDPILTQLNPAHTFTLYSFYAFPILISYFCLRSNLCTCLLLSVFGTGILHLRFIWTHAAGAECLIHPDLITLLTPSWSKCNDIN